MTQMHPALERVLGPELHHRAVLELLVNHPSPAAIRSLGRARLATGLRRCAPRKGGRLADEIWADPHRPAQLGAVPD